MVILKARYSSKIMVHTSLSSSKLDIPHGVSQLRDSSLKPEGAHFKQKLSWRCLHHGTIVLYSCIQIIYVYIFMCIYINIFISISMSIAIPISMSRISPRPGYELPAAVRRLKISDLHGTWNAAVLLQGRRSWEAGMPYWVAVRGLNLSCHNRDIQYMIWIWDDDNLN